LAACGGDHESPAIIGKESGRWSFKSGVSVGPGWRSLHGPSEMRDSTCPTLLLSEIGATAAVHASMGYASGALPLPRPQASASLARFAAEPPPIAWAVWASRPRRASPPPLVKSALKSPRARGLAKFSHFCPGRGAPRLPTQAQRLLLSRVFARLQPKLKSSVGGFLNSGWGDEPLWRVLSRRKTCCTGLRLACDIQPRPGG